MTDFLLRLHRAMPKTQFAVIPRRTNQLSVGNESRCQPQSHMKKLGGALADGAWVGTRTARPKIARPQHAVLIVAALVAWGPQQPRYLAVGRPCAGNKFD